MLTKVKWWGRTSANSKDPTDAQALLPKIAFGTLKSQIAKIRVRGLWAALINSQSELTVKVLWECSNRKKMAEERGCNQEKPFWVALNRVQKCTANFKDIIYRGISSRAPKISLPRTIIALGGHFRTTTQPKHSTVKRALKRDINRSHLERTQIIYATDWSPKESTLSQIRSTKIIITMSSQGRGDRHAKLSWKWTPNAKLEPRMADHRRLEKRRLILKNTPVRMKCSLTRDSSIKIEFRQCLLLCNLLLNGLSTNWTTRRSWTTKRWYLSIKLINAKIRPKRPLGDLVCRQEAPKQIKIRIWIACQWAQIRQ